MSERVKKTGGWIACGVAGLSSGAKVRVLEGIVVNLVLYGFESWVLIPMMKEIVDVCNI